MKYFLEIKQGHEIGTVTKTTNPDQSLSLSMQNTSFATFLNTKNLTKFEKAFPGLQRAILQRTYLIELPFQASIGDISSRQEVQNLELVPENDILLTDDTTAYSDILPNDYEDILISGRNQELDLIQAPLAWTISRGNGVLVGVSDSQIRLHEDLNDNIAFVLPMTPRPEYHGTGTAGKIVGITNNGIGVSSLAFESKVVSAPNTGYARVLALAQVPGVKVVNCSWASCNYNSYEEEMYDAIADELNVLVVASAGNNGGGYCADNAYRYPASYNSTVSVTGVGSKLYIGEYHNWIDPTDGNQYQTRSWKDCHSYRPENPSFGSQTHNDKVDVSAPGILVTGITDKPGHNGYSLGTGTSGAAPFVSALAALIYSINPNFTAAEVKDIIKYSTDDIYYIPYNQQYQGQLGTGRINAFRAVKTADCMVNPTSELDLGMQDTLEDYFEEPNINNSSLFWNSPDIWVRNQNDGKLIQKHENPEYDPNSPNYVYVRVTNNSCQTTGSPLNKLKLYWSKANTALAWPEHWDGTLYQTDPNTGQQILMGDEVGVLTIPPLSPGQSTILEIPWQMPNPTDYVNINYNPWHFCLLARIESQYDPMTVFETSNLRDNILNNNNIVLKNVTVVDIMPDSPNPQPIGGVLAVGNPDDVTKTYELKLFPENNESGKALYEEAEVTITLDSLLYNSWSNGGKQMLEAAEIKNRTIKATGGNALIENITLAPGETGTAYVSFNFLTKELTNKQRFVYHFAQKEVIDTVFVGGETFLVNKKQRDSFLADAGNDEEVDRNQTITLSAETISENATYNWYDPEGNLVHTGATLTLSPEMTTTYNLEVIANIDGFKDYDNVTVTVNPYRIESLTPNPSTTTVTVDYLIDGANSAYLMVVNMQTGSSENIILDTTTTQIDVDITNLTTGLYNIILICDGETQNSKTLSKN